MKDFDQLLEQIASGRDASMVLDESIGALIPAPDETAISVNIQKPVATSTNIPKGSLSIPIDVGTYPIDPQDAVKILFFKVATALEPFMASMIAFYPEGEELQYKVQDFVVKAAERISKQIDILHLEEYSDLGWIALAYLAEQNRMPILKNVLYGEYVGEYWMDAYGQCIYKDEDGISSSRFESDYRVFRSMINDYTTEDLITFAQVGTPAQEETVAAVIVPEASLKPEVDVTGANDQSSIGEGKDEEDEEDIFSIPGTYGEPVDKSVNKIATLSKGDLEETTGNDLVVGNTYKTPSGMGGTFNVKYLGKDSSGKHQFKNIHGDFAGKVYKYSDADIAKNISESEDDSVLDNDAIMALGTDSGLSVDASIDLIKRASSGKERKPELQEEDPEPEEEANPAYSQFSAEDVKRRLVRLESSSMVSAVINREEIKELKKELKRRIKEDTGINIEVDPQFNPDKDVNPNEDKPFKNSGASTQPAKSSTNVPSDIGSSIAASIDKIDNAESDADAEVESILFNISDAHPGDESTQGSEDKTRY